MDNETRVYSDADWAVRRWDAVNGGMIIQPRSFCQFWRTVVLWGTLRALLPWLFTNRHSPPPAPMADPEVPEAVKAAGRIAWAGLWPLRKLLTVAWWPFGTAIGFIDERPDLGRRLGAVVIYALIGLAGAAVIYLVATRWDWEETWFLLIMAALIFPIVSIILLVLRFATTSARVERIFRRLGRVVTATASAIGTAGQLGWDIAATNKRRICPPMRIERRG